MRKSLIESIAPETLDIIVFDDDSGRDSDDYSDSEE